MTTDKDKLEALRREIDGIDDSIQDLITQRTKVVKIVRNAKRDQKIKIKPTREAQILYRLMDHHTGPFPKKELARIWRELIIATLRFEGPFSVAVSVPEGELGYWNVARNQYGAFTPMTGHVSSRSVVEAVRKQEATVGILPLPRRDDVDPWWQLLVSQDPETPRIIARLPFIPSGNGPGEDLEALAICPVGQEETGRDCSFLAIEAEEDIGFASIESALAQAGCSAALTQLRHVSDRPASWTYLVEVFEFIDNSGWQIPRLTDSLGKRTKQVLHLGGYATPLSEAELASDTKSNTDRGADS